jgi:hypothetical protein
MCLYSLVNRVIYGHRVRAHRRGVLVYSLVRCNRGIVPMNIVTYICRRYISRFLCRLNEEYIIYSSVMNVCSSVITDECVCVSCCESK